MATELFVVPVYSGLWLKACRGVKAITRVASDYVWQVRIYLLTIIHRSGHPMKIAKKLS